MQTRTYSPAQQAARRAERRRLQRVASDQVHDTGLQAAQARARWQGAAQVMNALSRSEPSDYWQLTASVVNKLLKEQHEAEERAEMAMRRLASFDHDYSNGGYSDD